MRVIASQIMKENWDLIVPGVSLALLQVALVVSSTTVLAGEMVMITDLISVERLLAKMTTRRLCILSLVCIHHDHGRIRFDVVQNPSLEPLQLLEKLHHCVLPLILIRFELLWPIPVSNHIDSESGW